MIASCRPLMRAPTPQNNRPMPTIKAALRVGIEEAFCGVYKAAQAALSDQSTKIKTAQPSRRSVSIALTVVHRLGVLWGTLIVLTAKLKSTYFPIRYYSECAEYLYREYGTLP